MPCEEPHDLPMPAEGTYCLFELDPVATLESLDDAETREAASKMRTQKYAGYVVECSNAFDASHPFRMLHVRLLHQTLPVASDADGIEPGMCSAVLPTTEHPTGRPPLEPLKPLPWPKCYHHTIFPRATFRVREAYTSDEGATRLPRSEYSDHREACMDDRERRDELRAQYREAHPELPKHEGRDDPETAGGAPLRSASDSPSAVDPPDDVLQGASGSTSGIVPDIAAKGELVPRGRPHDTMALANTTYDLSSVTTWGAPEDFFKEQACIQQLEKDYRARAIERARLADEEAYGASTAQMKKSFSKRRILVRPKQILSAAKTRLQRLASTVLCFKKWPRKVEP